MTRRTNNSTKTNILHIFVNAKYLCLQVTAMAYYSYCALSYPSLSLFREVVRGKGMLPWIGFGIKKKKLFFVNVPLCLCFGLRVFRLTAHRKYLPNSLRRESVGFNVAEGDRQKLRDAAGGCGLICF